MTPISMTEALCLMKRLENIIEELITDYSSYAKIIPRACDGDFKEALNRLIESDGIRCNTALVTTNIDKQNFGIYIMPSIGDYEISRIINDCEDNVKFTEFNLEIDSRLLDRSYSTPEILALIFADIYGVMNVRSAQAIRFAIDACICNSGRAAAGYIIKPVQKNYQFRIMRYAMVAFLRNLYTFAGDDQVEPSYSQNHLMSALKLAPIALDIYKDRAVALRGGSNLGSELSVFNWAFGVIDNIELHLADAIDTLVTIRNTTGSVLEADMLDGIIESLKKGVDMDPSEKYVKESSVLTEFSLFKSLKINGLRGIEDDLYEYRIRIKNCEDEEDAMYILRQINTRLTILEDYVRNEDKLSESERARWRSCIDSYRELRYQLGQKKIGGKKQYGVFIDYDKLDQL